MVIYQHTHTSSTSVLKGKRRWRREFTFQGRDYNIYTFYWRLKANRKMKTCVPKSLRLFSPKCQVLCVRRPPSGVGDSHPSRPDVKEPQNTRRRGFEEKVLDVFVSHSRSSSPKGIWLTVGDWVVVVLARFLSKERPRNVSPVRPGTPENHQVNTR